MASIEGRTTKDGAERWRLRWRQDGKRQEITFADRGEAERFRMLVEGSGNRWPNGWEPVRPGPAAPLTFGAWALTAIEHRSRANERTKVDYRRDLDRHMTLLAGVPLTDVDAHMVAGWLTDRRKAGLSEKTIRNLHGFGSSIMADALAQHPPLVDYNPFLKRLGKFASVRTEEMVFLTPQEFNLVAGHVREEYRDLIRFLYGTGMRFGEATALRVGDVDLFGKRKTVTVTKAWKRTGPANYVVGEPKTPQSRRTISVSPELVDLLIPLVSARRSDELLFPGVAGGRLPHIEVYKRGWGPAVARARVCDTHFAPQRNGRGKPPLTPVPCNCPEVLHKTPRIHDLRHSHVAALIAQGVQLPAISRRLGHSSITITFDRYGHLDPSLDAQIDAAVDQSLRAGRVPSKAEQDGAGVPAQTGPKVE